jgi:2-keto-4-pentenoate hydratase/2-oxohepta-3-ene-1,7-dioic acid hydratase in catechol pathway
MRLVSYSSAEGATALPGVLVPLGAPLDAHTHVVDLVSAFAADGGPALTRGMRQVIESGLERARAAAESGSWRVPVASVKLHAPISDPEKIICVGMNYYDHCTEQNFPIPQEPVLFSKFASSISGPGAPIPLEEELTSELDFEVELCIVVGKRGRHIPKASALEHIAGWTVAHDVRSPHRLTAARLPHHHPQLRLADPHRPSSTLIDPHRPSSNLAPTRRRRLATPACPHAAYGAQVSARDLQLKRNGGQWLLGKTGDGYSPIGPAIVTRDEGAAYVDAGALGLRTFVNGQRLQESNTRELIFKVRQRAVSVGTL